MSVARRFAVAFSVVGLGALAYAVPVSATEGDKAAAGSLPCVDGTNLANLELVGALDPTLGKVVVRGKGGAPICEGQDVALTLSVYRVPDTWDGNGFPSSGDGKAWPQTELAHQTAVLDGAEPVELQVEVPTCGNVQIDLYEGQSIPEIGQGGHPADRIIFGYIWSVGGPNGDPEPCVETPPSSPATQTSTSAPPSSPGTPIPAPSTSSAAPSTSPAPSTPAPTTPAVAAPGVTTPAPTQAITAPIVVVPPKVQQVETPPVLAATGSDATRPLIGIGVALVAGGIGLSLLGRRRRTT